MIFQNRFPVSLLYVYLLMIVSFTERFVQQQAPSSFSMISINLLSGNNHGWCHSIHLNVSYFALRRRDRPYSMITHYMDMYLNRCRRPSIWAWTCMNNYRGTSILTWQPRRLTGPEHSLQGTFTAGAPHRAHTVQNCHKLEQVQRRAAQFACHRYEKTASVTAMMNDLKWESLDTRRNNQRLIMFYRMQHNIVSFTPADHLVPVQRSYGRRSGHDEMYQVPYARTSVYKYSFPATVCMWNTTFISDPFSFTSVLQNNCQCL